MLHVLNEDAIERYKKDAALVIKELYENRIKLKHGELNSIGVVLLVAAMDRLLREKSVTEIVETVSR